jgi:hypothetical protein
MTAETGTGKTEQLLKRCRRLAPIVTAVAHPCEETALAGALEAAKHKVKQLESERKKLEHALLETSERKVESLRGFLRLTEHAQAVWEARLWAAQPRTLGQLRAKQRHYEQVLDGLRQWRALMEQSLAAVSEQVLRQVLRAEDTRLLREVAINLNCGHLMLLLQFGNMRKDLVTYNTDLFLRRVKPQLQDLFDDKWEDRWWPKPLTEMQVARPRAVAS